MAEIFRKSLLDKLSSPEQLDKTIVITPPSFWVALSGAGIIIAAALAWSVFGRLPVNVEAQGIYVNKGGTYNVYSTVGGIVRQVEVKEGDYVKKGDVIAYLDTEEVQKKLDDYAERMDKVKALTMESEADVVTADNKTLLDIKEQMLTVDQTLCQNQVALEVQLENLETQRKKALDAEQKMQEAEALYYSSLNTGDSTDEQLAYTEAQTSLANAGGYLESAYSGLDQAEVDYTQALGAFTEISNSLNQLQAQRDFLMAVIEEKQGILGQLYLDNGLEGEISKDNVQASLDEGAFADLPEVGLAAEEYVAAVDNFTAFQEDSAEAEAQYLQYFGQYKLELEAAEGTKNNYQESVDNFSRQKADAANSYNSAKAAYLGKLSSVGQAQQFQTKVYNQYSIAMNQYNSEKAALTNLEDNVKQLKLQVRTDKANVDKQIETIHSQFDITKASILDQLQMEYDQCKEELEQCTIVSSVNGRISDLPLVTGSAVQQGSVLAKVRQGEDNVVVCYVPLSSGKKITEGMRVLVYPTTVNKQEYGHMEATVEAVDAYVSSAESLQEQLGNDSLVDAFLKNGPVLGVTCRLVTDDETQSGYYWSSKKGASLTIEENTLVESSVVIEEKMPISMLIPYLKEKLTVHVAPEQR